MPSTPPETFLDNLLNAKSRTLKSAVNALLEEIDMRKSLNADLLDSIENQKTDLSSQITTFRAVWPRYDWSKFQEFNELKGNLEKKILALDQEMRKEQLECWRDLMFLNKYLMSALREYWDFKQRSDSLSWKNEDRRPD